MHLTSRRAIRLASLVACATASLALPLAAQRGGGGGGDSTRATLPLTPTKPLKFSTDEGTWMSLDVSPDGKTIAFDILGDLYTIPVTGGAAKRLTSGQQFDGQPHFSPDGKTIVFTSDKTGSDALWLMNADGTNPRAITREEQRNFISPTWSPDGKYIVVSKNAALFGSAYDLWMYHKDGGAGIKLTGNEPAPAAGARAGGPGGNALNNFVGPAFGKDARYIYTAARNGAGGYNQTSLGWQIGVFDRETGHTYIRTNANGSGMRPALSPDGKWLVYATRNDSLTALRIRDLATGDEHWLAPNVQRDDQESRFSRDLVPPYTFTPDSKSVIAAHHGHFWKIDVADGKQTMIPFTAEVDQMIAGAIKGEYPVNDSTLNVRQIRSPVTSPDGKRLAFVALDKLWMIDLPAGKAKRVTATANLGEFSPAWSPDGKYLAYVTWNEAGGGDLYRISTDGKGKPEKLSSQPGFYDKLTYSADGKKLVVARGPREMRRDRDELGGNNAEAAGVELVYLPATGGAFTTITPLTRYGQPHVGPDSGRIYIYEPSEGLVSIRWDGTDRKALLKATMGGGGGGGGGGGASEVLLSPDGERALVLGGTNLYIVNAVPMAGTTQTVNLSNPAQAVVPVRRITRIGGDFPAWAAGGKKVTYALGHSYFSYDIGVADSLVRDSTARADSVRNAPRGGGAGAGAGAGAGVAGSALATTTGRGVAGGPSMMTVMPWVISLTSRTTSQLAVRMQPWLEVRPMFCGEFVP